MGHVVVTGSSGFIGRALVSRLRRDGHTVIGVDRRPPAGPAASDALVLDLAEPAPDLVSVLREADAVFHLAGCPGVRDSGPDVAGRRHRDNVVATARLLRAVPLSTPLVAVSSSSVYGGARTDGGVVRASREDDMLRPLGGYARSKVALERLCDARRSRGGHVAVVRPFTVAGEHQRPDMALARWIRAARAGEALPILGSPDRVRDITDVRHVAEGIVRAADTGATVNLGTGQAWTLRRLAAAVARALGADAAVRVVPVSSDEPPATLADTGRCERILGFRPVTDLDALVRRQALAVAELAAPISA